MFSDDMSRYTFNTAARHIRTEVLYILKQYNVAKEDEAMFFNGNFWDTSKSKVRCTFHGCLFMRDLILPGHFSHGAKKRWFKYF